MPEPDQRDGLSFVSVRERRVSQTVQRLKATLPEEPRECPACDYEGALFRWGIKTCPGRDSRHVALVLCCPGCERPTDLPSLGDGV